MTFPWLTDREGSSEPSRMAERIRILTAAACIVAAVVGGVVWLGSSVDVNSQALSTVERSVSAGQVAAQPSAESEATDQDLVSHEETTDGHEVTAEGAAAEEDSHEGSAAQDSTAYEPGEEDSSAPPVAQEPTAQPAQAEPTVEAVGIETGTSSQKVETEPVAQEEPSQASPAQSQSQQQPSQSQPQQSKPTSPTSSGASTPAQTNAQEPSQPQNPQSQQQEPSNPEPAQPQAISVTITVDGSAAGSSAWSKSLSLSPGSTVYDALVAADGNVNARSTGYGIYVGAIDGLAEMDHGSKSGWMYAVNGNYPNIACSNYKLKDGDSITWVYVNVDY